jgi:peptidoglycan/LPS O-acetylase OafA/YrhL
MPARCNYWEGLNSVRLVALVLVSVQHALTLSGCDAWAKWGSLSPGQFGVALFLAVSGLLASESRRPPLDWLYQRLKRLMPTYWVALAASFVAVGILGNRSFDLYQIFAQFVGIGLFTHKDNLVNLPTWFISLLLVCYLGTVAARYSWKPWLYGTFMSIVLAVYVGFDSQPWLLSHLLTYAVASTAALAPRNLRGRIILPLSGLLVALAIWVQPAFAYTATALVAIELAVHLKASWWPVRIAGEYSYEYFLVHGPIFYGAIIVLLAKQPLLAVLVAVPCSLIASAILHWGMVLMGHLLSRLKTARRPTLVKTPQSIAMPTNRLHQDSPL